MVATIAGIRLTLEDGTDLTDRFSPRLLELSLTEKRGEEADELSVTLHNHDGLLIAPDKGTVLALALGWVSGVDVPLGLVSKGRFRVDEVREGGPPDKVTIRARSADFTGDYRRRRTQSWRDTTVGEILTTIATRNGLSAQVHPDLADKPVSVIEQHNKSDMAFVKDLGSRYDALSTWKDRRLIFMPVGSTTTASGKTIPSTTIHKVDGWTWESAFVEREEQDGAEAQYHDPAAGRRRTVKRGGDKRRRLKRVYSSEEEATQAADAAVSKGKRGARTFTYELARALPDLQPNGRVALLGWNSRIDALKWVVESVETSFDGDGLKQRIALESV
ncbi:contractile injection system protein, VgrG/Pvc8 family [Sphingomonas sp.]|uniref:contractile injection system protein, VgrG/Pvc8 family n=1 Tax=Sphingomonas sp. TaxID=28214 RepID=UPI003F6EADC6